MKDVLSCEDISQINVLFDQYKTIPGNSNATMDSFYSFLSTDSAERTLFLEEYCDYTYIRVNRSYVLKVKPKTR